LFEDRDVGCSAGRRDDGVGEADQLGRRRLLIEIGAQFGGAGDGGGEADAHEAGCEAAEAGEVEGEEVAALGGGERVQFVEDDGVEGAE